MQKRYLRKIGVELGLPETLGWHTFRHTYRSWLDAAGVPVGVQQRLMRHAHVSTTMNVYGNALMESKRDAQQRIVGMLSRSPSENCFLKAASAAENRIVNTARQSSPHEARSNAWRRVSRAQPSPL